MMEIKRKDAKAQRLERNLGSYLFTIMARNGSFLLAS